ncbi:hypothetical protein ACHAWF_011267, partial [Thalassiosira exigua]
ERGRRRERRRGRRGRPRPHPLREAPVRDLDLRSAGALRPPADVRGVRPLAGIALPRIVGVRHGPRGLGGDGGLLGGDHRLLGGRVHLPLAVQDAHRDEDGAHQEPGRGHLLHLSGVGVGPGERDGPRAALGVRPGALQDVRHPPAVRAAGSPGEVEIAHRLHAGAADEPNLGVQPHPLHAVRSRESLRAGGAHRVDRRGGGFHHRLERVPRARRRYLPEDAAVGVPALHRRSTQSQDGEEADHFQDRRGVHVGGGRGGRGSGGPGRRGIGPGKSRGAAQGAVPPARSPLGPGNGRGLGVRGSAEGPAFRAAEDRPRTDREGAGGSVGVHGDDGRREAQAAEARRQYGEQEATVREHIKSPRSIITASHAMDIMHGMIEGYVVVDHQLLFCTLRAGRMLFWADSHHAGHAPPKSVWDVSGMAVLEARGDGVNTISSGKSEDLGLDIGDDDDDNANEDLGIYEWTIILGHIHRHMATSSIEDDSMKLVIHGLKDHSDHDGQDWHDALAVASSTLNPIALRLAHIRKELHFRRGMEGGASARGGLERRTASHSHRNEIICIGYNEMFPAVLALADAVSKEVVVVEYDPMKLNAIEKLYSEEKRRMDAFKKSKKRSSRNSLRDLKEAYTTDDIGRPRGLEKGSTPPRPRPRRVRTMSTPVLQQSVDPNQFFWASHSSSSDNLQGLGKGGGKGLKGEVKGVKCEYADVHDPECWEELEMDQAFMVVCTIKGARHAEKAMLDWLRRRESDAIFVACTQNNVEAMQMYKAGAHFVMQTDALAMRSTRDIFLETVANFGDCSQLKAAGLSHMKRLKKLEEEDKLKWLYETG